MKDRSRLLHFVIHLIHPIPNFLVLSFHLNTFYFFFLPSNPSSPRCTLQNPSKSLKILRCHATVLVHLSILAIIPWTGSQPGRRKEAACAPWKRRQLVGWQREIGSTRSSQERGWRTARVLRGSPSVGMKASRASGSEWGPKRARSGQNNVKSALPTPGRNFRSPLLPRLALLPLPLLRQHRYPTTSLKYLSSPGGLTLVKWYRDTWTVGLLIFRSKPLENSPSSRLKYRPK